jgi:hypothetical protein
MKLKTHGILAIALAGWFGWAAAPVHAATLDGTTVTVDLAAGGSDQGTQSLLVGAGADGNYFGNQFLDFNAGINGDIFTITSSGTFCGILCAGGDVVWTLTNLNFGVPLTGFTVLQDIGPVTIDSLTANSVTFSYADGTGIPNGTYFQAQFVTSAVPEPSTWAMMLLGFAGLGFMAYRRKSKPTLIAT